MTAVTRENRPTIELMSRPHLGVLRVRVLPIIRCTNWEAAALPRNMPKTDSTAGTSGSPETETDFRICLAPTAPTYGISSDVMRNFSTPVPTMCCAGVGAARSSSAVLAATRVVPPPRIRLRLPHTVAKPPGDAYLGHVRTHAPPGSSLGAGERRTFDVGHSCASPFRNVL